MTFLVDNSSESISQESFLMMMVEPIMDVAPIKLRRVVSDEKVASRTSSVAVPAVPPPARRRKSESDAQTRIKKRRRVTIQMEPLQVVEGEPLPEKECCWYSKEDLLTSRRIARKQSRQVNSDPVLMETYHKACEEPHNNPSSSSSSSPALEAEEDITTAAVQLLKHSSAFWKLRGLERLAKCHSICRSIQVCSVKSAVLLEQSSQYLEGVQDPERLARASLSASRPSSQFAHMLAMADQAMAERIHQL